MNTNAEDFVERLGFCDNYMSHEKEAILKDLQDKTIVGWVVIDEGYESDATLVCRDGDDWFIWEGSHCSCMGFEDQWGLERSSPDALLAKRFWGTDDFHQAITEELRK